MPYNAIISTSLEDTNYTEIIDLADVKKWCAVNGSGFDDMLNTLIQTAGKQCEDYVNKAFIQRDITVVVRNELGNVQLPYSPIGDISEVKDIDGNVITDYEVKAGMLIKPVFNYVEIKYACGFESLPQVFSTAIMQQVLYLFNNRGDVPTPSTGSHRMQMFADVSNLGSIAKTTLAPYRVVV